jgi:peptidoglycan/LPS O-acetylase OafA/YrhL
MVTVKNLSSWRAETEEGKQGRGLIDENRFSNVRLMIESVNQHARLDPRFDPPRRTPSHQWGEASAPIMKTSSGFRHLPFMDGLRALSIALVMGVHDLGPISGSIARALNGWMGVDVFFVISGFLITSLLAQELASTGTLSVRRFWMRRVLRIMPAYYVFLLAMAILLGAAALPSLAVAGIYLTDYDSALGWGHLGRFRDLLGHTWSLAIEEQFYLLWPALFYVVLTIRSSKLLYNRGIIGITAAIALVVLWRAYLVTVGASDDRLYLAFDTRFDAILIGCLAAVLWAAPGCQAQIRSRLSSAWAPWIVLAALLWSAGHLGFPHSRGLSFWVASLPLHNALVALLVLSLLVHPYSRLTTLLSQRVITWIGRLSYSLYLWHVLVFYGVSRKVPVTQWLGVSGYSAEVVLEVLKLGTVVTVASMSYYLIERPFLQLKKRWKARGVLDSEKVGR